MSYSVSAYLVDWEELRKNWVARKGQDEWFTEAVENQEGWVEHFDVIPGEETAWIDTSHPWTDTGLAYDDLRDELEPTALAQFDKFFRAFFVGSEENHQIVRELTGDDTSDGVFHATISPPTAKALFQLAKSLPLEELREPFENTFATDGTGIIHDFDSFCAYIHQWIALLAQASASNKGLVVSIPY